MGKLDRECLFIVLGQVIAESGDRDRMYILYSTQRLPELDENCQGCVLLRWIEDPSSTLRIFISWEGVHLEILDISHNWGWMNYRPANSGILLNSQFSLENTGLSFQFGEKSLSSQTWDKCCAVTKLGIKPS